MSVLTYNGIKLPYGNTTSFTQEAVYEESRTDRILTKFDIQVQAVINYQYLKFIAPQYEGATSSPASIMAAIRTDLLEPRNNLSMIFNGTELIPQPVEGLAGTVDAKNGPQPQSCRIFRLTNTTFLIVYHIVAHYWEYNRITENSGNPNTITIVNTRGNGVLYNRWTESVDINNANYSRRIREGIYSIRSDNGEGQIADQFRDQMAVLGVPNGFLREGSHYSVSPDGLTIRYRVVDIEVFKAPPAPAFRAKGTYRESRGRGGVPRTADVYIRLEGDKYTPQNDLLESAISIASRKLAIGAASDFAVQNAGAVAVGAYIIQSAQAAVQLWENVVEVSMTVLFANKKTTVQNINAFDTTGITYVPGVDDTEDFVPEMQSRGTAGIVLQAAAYYDPSLTEAVLNSVTGQMVNGDGGDPLPEVGTVGLEGEPTIPPPE